MADVEPIAYTTAVYIGGDALLRPLDGTTILPGDRAEVDASLVDVDGSPWASRIPRGQADRLELLAHNHRAVIVGEPVKADPLARDEPAGAVDAKE